MKTVVSLLLFLSVAAVIYARTEGKVQSKLEAKTVMAATGITAPAKLCSGILNSSWRDTITVPDNFTPEACKGFTQSIGANIYQLGCVQHDSISWGGLNAGPPSPNCGW